MGGRLYAEEAAEVDAAVEGVYSLAGSFFALAPWDILIFLRPEDDVDADGKDEVLPEFGAGTGEALPIASPVLLPLAIFVRAARFLGAFSDDS